MYRTIVAGTDGSSTAQEAVRHATALAAATGASLHVVSAYAAPDQQDTGPGPRGGLDHVRVRADAVLEHCLMRLPAGGVTLRLQARPGEAGEVLLTVAGEVAADLVVLGTDTAAGLPRGRLSDRVATGARCAVLLVPPPRA